LFTRKAGLTLPMRIFSENTHQFMAHDVNSKGNREIKKILQKKIKKASMTKIQERNIRRVKAING
jgi:hypothetical protein